MTTTLDLDALKKKADAAHQNDLYGWTELCDAVTEIERLRARVAELEALLTAITRIRQGVPPPTDPVGPLEREHYNLLVRAREWDRRGLPFTLEDVRASRPPSRTPPESEHQKFQKWLAKIPKLAVGWKREAKEQVAAEVEKERRREQKGKTP